MPKSEFQKLKLLRLAQILTEQTDENHPMRVKDMIDALEKYDISAERKSIYSDLVALENFGMDVAQVKTGRTGYYLASRTFELPELKLLVDAVQSSRFLSPRKSRNLIQKLKTLCSHHEALDLQRQVYATQRAKSGNETIYYAIDALHSAINQNKKITFTYFTWTVNKEQLLRHHGAMYRVSPYALVWDSENYYLVAYDGQAQQIKHYRVDKMLHLQVSDLTRDGHEIFDKMDIASYTQKMFGMFGGHEEQMTLQFANHLAGVVIDRFGQEVMLSPVDDAHFQAHIRAVPSPQFMGWIASFGTQARIVSPKNVADAFAKQCRDTLALYGL